MSFWPFPKILLDELHAGLARGPGIELGAGSGRLRDRMASAGIELLTSDLNAPCELRADAMDLPLRSRAFGLVVAGNLVRHIPSPRRPRFFTEAARVLRPGGRLLLLEDHPEGRTPAESNYREALELLARVDGSRGVTLDLQTAVRDRGTEQFDEVWSGLLQNEERPVDPLAPANWIEARAQIPDDAVQAHRREVLAHGMEYGLFQACVLERCERTVRS